MAVTSGFFNSLNHDRTYNAEQVSALFDGLISDGIFQNIGNNLITVAGDGMSVIVRSGRAWFNHTWTLNDTDLVLDIDESSVGDDRVDAVVLKIDKTETGRVNSIEIYKGIPGEGKPEIVDDAEIFYRILAYVIVKTGVSEITNEDIESMIGTESCPFVSSPVQVYNINELMIKWSEAFMNWFDHLQDELDADQATHLQHQIDDNAETEFKRYYDLCTRNTHYARDNYGDITGWTSEGDGLTLETVITNTEESKTIVTTINDGTYIWTKTNVFDKTTDDLSETYTKEVTTG